MINKVKQAKSLRDEGKKNDEITEIVGIHKNYITPLIELYDEMKSQKPEWNLASSDYVMFRKQKYIKLSLDIQHKLNDIRIEYSRKKDKMDKHIKVLQTFLESKNTVDDLEHELFLKQKQLNTVSTRLDYVEDHFELQQQQMWVTRVTWLFYGMVVVFGVNEILKFVVGHGLI